MNPLDIINFHTICGKAVLFTLYDDLTSVYQPTSCELHKVKRTSSCLVLLNLQKDVVCKLDD